MSFLPPGMNEALTIIGILLQSIVGLLLYIFKSTLDAVKKENAALKEAAQKHAETNDREMGELRSMHARLTETVTELHIILPNEYVKQTFLASIQLELKGDISKVFDKMDELRDMMISMGADRRGQK